MASRARRAAVALVCVAFLCVASVAAQESVAGTVEVVDNHVVLRGIRAVRVPRIVETPQGLFVMPIPVLEEYVRVSFDVVENDVDETSLQEMDRAGVADNEAACRQRDAVVSQHDDDAIIFCDRLALVSREAQANCMREAIQTYNAAQRTRLMSGVLFINQSAIGRLVIWVAFVVGVVLVGRALCTLCAASSSPKPTADASTNNDYPGVRAAPVPVVRCEEPKEAGEMPAIVMRWDAPELNSSTTTVIPQIYPVH